MKVRFSSQSDVLKSPTLRQRWESSWWMERVEVRDLHPRTNPILRGGLLAASRHERVRPIVGMISLFAFLGSQCVLPGAFLLTEVRADEMRRTQVTKAQEKEREAKTPAWAKKLRAAIAKEKTERAARLSQADGQEEKSQGSLLRLVQAPGRGAAATHTAQKPPVIPVRGSKPGQVVPSAPAECDDCEVDVRALDLSQVPTERALRRAGQLGGALTPLRFAEPTDVGMRLDKLMRRAGLEEGLKTKVHPKDPRARALGIARAKFGRAQAINLSFGQAIQEWNTHNYRKAAGMFKEHLKKFPESPWAGEAELHLGCDAKYNGRFDEAQARYDGLLRTTRDTRNDKNKAKKRNRRQGGAEVMVQEQNEAVEQAMAKSKSLEEAVELVNAATEADDESFDIHMKAQARYADLDIAVGRWDDSAKKLQDLLARDTDWRRRTWAQAWLTSLSNMAPEAKRLAACGPKALERVLISLQKGAAARTAGAVVPKTMAGLSLAEMESLSARSGAPMRAFKVSDPGNAAEAGAALAKLSLPAIVHLDGSRGFNRSTGYLATRELKRAPMVALHSSERKAGQMPAKIARALQGDQGGAAMSLFKSGMAPSGHYLVMEANNPKARSAQFYDPQEKRFYQLSYAEIAKQWSGKGLALAGKTRLAGVPRAEKEKTRGGCCGAFRPTTGKGCCPDGDDGNGGCNGAGGTGGGGNKDPLPKAAASPIWSVNPTNLNLFVKDTPLWVKTPKGPDVEITVSYNSQDAISQHNAFGNKWMFNYGSYVVEDPQARGGQTIVFMPDGSEDVYSPNSQVVTATDEKGNTSSTLIPDGTFTADGTNRNKLFKLSGTRYEVHFPGGDKAIYDIPSGTTSQQPFLLELRDRWGYSLTFGYDAAVHLTTITDAGGGVTSLRYNAAGKVSSVWDPFGRHASFSYDANNNLVECIDMEGHAFQYTYDGGTYLTRLNTAQGPWTFSHFYGYPDRVLTASDPAGKSESWTGNWWGPSYTQTDKRGVTKSSGATVLANYEGRISSESFADGTSSSKGIDTSTGLPTAITGRDGQTTRMTYNAQGQPLSITDSKNQTTTLTYHDYPGVEKDGIDVASITNAQNQVVATYQYDAFHQPTQISDITGKVTTLTYTGWGAPLSVSANGKTTELTYNALGQLAAASLNGVTLGGTTYDAKGRVASQTDAAGLRVDYQYNNIDHVTREIYQAGTPQETTVEYDYTCCGLAGVVKDRAGRRTYYDYDAMRRLVRTQDAAGNTLQMDYDAEGNLARLLDGKGNTTRWQYDGMNRLAKKIYADGSERTYGYSGGRLGGTRDARNRLTGFFYDANGNLSGIDYPNQADVALTYNALDKPLTMTDGLGTTVFGYDNAGRLTSTDGPWANDTLTYGYDEEGQRKSLGVQLPGGAVDSTRYAYDTLGRLDALTSNPGTASESLYDYSYEGNSGRISQLLMPNGTKTTYSYTALGELDVLQNWAPNGNGFSNISRYDYNYDARGVRTALQEQIEQDPVKTLMFSYDPANQLTGESVTGGKMGETYNASYQYDSAGNRTRFEKTTATSNTVTTTGGNKLNQTLSASTVTDGAAPLASGYSYDEAGNLAQVSSSGGRSDYAFDDASRLTSIVNRDVSGAAVSKSEFAYDGMSRLRISRDSDMVNGAWVSRGEKWRLYDGMNAVQERDGSGALVATYTRGSEMGGGIGGLLCRTFSTGNAGTSFYHYDGRGNVTGLSDGAGVVSGKYAYDAFGNTISQTGGAAGLNSYRFSTKEQVGGLVYYGYRFYAPSMGKWINRDPIAEIGGVNLYGFVFNNAISNYDIDGRILPAVAAALATMVIGCVAAGVGAALMKFKKEWDRWQEGCAFDWDLPGFASYSAYGCLMGGMAGFFGIPGTIKALIVSALVATVAGAIETLAGNNSPISRIDDLDRFGCPGPATYNNGPFGEFGPSVMEFPGAAGEMTNELTDNINNLINNIF